jgi:hypothetical protein
MKKKSLEIIMTISSVCVFIVLIIATHMILGESAGYGYSAALLIFILMMAVAGLKLAEIPDRKD